MKTYINKNYKNEATVKCNYPKFINMLLYALDNLLEFMNERLHTHHAAIRKNLITLLKPVITIDKVPEEINYSTEKFKNLNFNEELTFLYISAALSLSHYQRYNSGNKDFQILVLDSLRPYFHLAYYCIKSIEGPLSKDEAIEFYKSYLTNLHYNGEKKETIEEVLPVNSKLPPIFQYSFISHDFDLEDGRVGTKIEKCKWAEVMNELNDPDYAYVTTCHWDFVAISHMNKNYVLTRNQTLIKNKPYCDFCWHDKKRVKEIIHPDETFWENLGSLL